MSSKMKCYELRDMIKYHFAKQGKRMSNISKATKPKLLQIVEQYNICSIEYKKNLQVDAEEELIEKQKEEEDKKLKEEAEQIEKLKEESIRKLLYKKWFDEYMKKDNKNVIKAYYNFIFESEMNDYECKKNKIDAESLLDSLKTAKKIMNDVGGDRSQDIYNVIHNEVSVKTNTGMCPNIMINTSMCRHLRNDLQKPIKIPIWRRRDIMKLF